MQTIAEGLDAVRGRIQAAARRAQRDPAEITLVAVSKRKPASAVREAYAAGQRDFGENYVQELVDKASALVDLPGLRWHLIGHLQRNKARQVVSVVSLLHTVDSPRLALELGQRAAQRPGSAEPLPVLVEVNVGGEAQKSGVSPGELAALLGAVEAQPSLALRGLMTVPPHTEDPVGARPCFEELARLREEHGGRGRLPELSMGMTHDLEQAIFAGATLVRVGTAIFGARQ